MWLLLAYVAQVVRSEEPEALDVYCAVQPNMAWRLAWSQPLRYSRRLSPGVLQAPYGAAAVCFINVVGAATLMAWNTEVAQVCGAFFTNLHVWVVSGLASAMTKTLFTEMRLVSFFPYLSQSVHKTTGSNARAGIPSHLPRHRCEGADGGIPSS